MFGNVKPNRDHDFARLRHLDRRREKDYYRWTFQPQRRRLEPILATIWTVHLKRRKTLTIKHIPRSTPLHRTTKHQQKNNPLPLLFLTRRTPLLQTPRLEPKSHNHSRHNNERPTTLPSQLIPNGMQIVD